MDKRRWCLVLGIVGVIGLSGGLDLAAAQPPPRPFPGAQPDLVPADTGAGPTTDKKAVQLTCYVRNKGNAPAGKFLIQGLVDGTPPRNVVNGRNPIKEGGKEC